MFKLGAPVLFHNGYYKVRVNREVEWAIPSWLWVFIENKKNYFGINTWCLGLDHFHVCVVVMFFLVLFVFPKILS